MSLKKISSWIDVYTYDMDFRSTLKGLLIFVLILLFFWLPKQYWKIQGRSLNKEVIGCIDFITPVKAIIQSDAGAKVITTGFKMGYSYEVNMIPYSKEIYIDRRTLNPKQYFQLKRSNSSDSILVFYDGNFPSKSIVGF
ncbi:MAG: hypothetical protein AAFO07_27610 [Bacteroidota bacterium]